MTQSVDVYKVFEDLSREEVFKAIWERRAEFCDFEDWLDARIEQAVNDGRESQYWKDHFKG